MTTATNKDLMAKIEEVAAAIQESVNAYFANRFPSLTPDKVNIRGRSKFVAIDIGTSGAFLVEKATGELFNIQAYGRPDRNKKRKADIGNVYTVDGSTLFAKRYNSLR